jgi:hypothetical protein
MKEKERKGKRLRGEKGGHMCVDSRWKPTGIQFDHTREQIAEHICRAGIGRRARQMGDKARREERERKERLCCDSLPQCERPEDGALSPTAVVRRATKDRMHIREDHSVPSYVEHGGNVKPNREPW